MSFQSSNLASEDCVALQLLSCILHIKLHSVDCVSISVLVALDFSKAFDTVNHELLLKELKCYGLSESALSLISSFLSDCFQRVTIYNLLPVFSSPRTLSSGKSQGFVLRPLFFSIFAADSSSLQGSTYMQMIFFL